METLSNKLTIRGWAVALCTLLLVGLAACAAAKATTLPEITVEITDDAVKTPAEMPAGFVAVTFVDRRSEPKDGVPIIIRLHDGVSMEEALAEGDPTAPPKATMLGGQVGRSIFHLEVGNYFIQWASEDAQPPAPAAFSVQGNANDVSAPKAAVQLNLVDFSFTLPDTVPGGKQLWQITNQGNVTHHALILKLNDGASDDDLTTWLMQMEPTGPPPAQLVVHGAPHDPGVTSWPEIDLAPGTYYVVCFLPDFSKNPPLPHVAHGMLRRFIVQ
ncbi:MAG: hypothetical protein DYG89_36460 [Caldilinea sp. CFX5]|nr:hypothetical protein [Caldilinea sp. CFX5]